MQVFRVKMGVSRILHHCVTCGAVAVDVTSDNGCFGVILVAGAGGNIGAFVNACPHQYLLLNYRSDTRLSADGTKLMGRAHRALSLACDGAVVTGADRGLDAVSTETTNGDIRIGP